LKKVFVTIFLMASLARAQSGGLACAGEIARLQDEITSLQTKLDHLFERLQKVMDSYEEEDPE